jgi:diguanylate cyclase (GGDEF)-like protein/PAS domain S-box-containing protein
MSCSAIAMALQIAVCAVAILAIGDVFGSWYSLADSAWPAAMSGILAAGFALIALCLGVQRLAIVAALFTTVSGSTVLLLFVLAYGGLNMSLTEFGAGAISLLDVPMNVAGPLMFLGSAILFLAVSLGRPATQGLAFAIGGGVLVVVTTLAFILDGEILARAPSLVHRHPLPLETLLILMLAVSIMLHAKDRSVKRIRNNPQLFPALGFMLLLAMSFNVWLDLVEEEHAGIHQRTVDTSQYLSNALEERQADRMDALRRMADRHIAASGEQREDEWRADAAAYIADYPELCKIALIGPDRMIRWLIARDNVSAVSEGERYDRDQARSHALDEAFDQRQELFSAPVTLITGELGKIAVQPMFSGGQFLGWVTAGIEYQSLFETTASSVAGRFDVRIQYDNREIFNSRSGNPSTHPLAPVVVAHAEVTGRDWTVIIRPGDDFMQQRLLWRPFLILLLGMLAAVLFAYSLYQLNQARAGIRRLEASENRFTLIAEQTGQLIYNWDIANNTIETAGARHIIDPDMPDSVSIEWWMKHLYEDDRQAITDRLMLAVEKAEPVTLTYRLVNSRNRIRWIEGKGIPAFDENRNVNRMLGTLADITSQRKVEEQLQLAANALESTADGVFILDADLKMVTANRAFENITGFGEADYLHKRWYESLTDDSLRARYRKIARAAHKNGSWVGETAVPRRNDDPLPVQLSFTAVHDEDGMISSYVGVFSDVSARIENHAMLQHTASHDRDTGLLNRSAFQQRLELETVKSREDGDDACCWIMHMDIDRFETINDTLGHATGDYLIYQLAARISECIGDRGRVARSGGDEFAIMLPGKADDRMEGFTVWLELSAILAEPFVIGDQTLYITVSAGAACLTLDDANPMDVFRAADVAMYQAKRRGRNQLCFYDETMNADSRRNLLIANSLPVALEKGEFELHFQPRYSLLDEEITGMEALIRWNKPGEGMISPATFIPIAEETGMILPIGWWVIEAAVDAALRIGEERMNKVRIAINVSARQFAQADFVAGIVRRVESVGASPKWFELEITESLLMDKPDFARQQLERLHDSGFTIAIDDFGTGYSSLNYLKHFAVDYLKIDQSFVRGLPDDKDDVAIVDTIIGMSHGLGLKLVAEGIEEKEQAIFLQQRGCGEGQGYHFARPMPLEDLLAVLVPA